MTHQHAPWPPHGPTVIVQTSRPRQSCAIHAILAITTLGFGNVAYAIWHNHRHGH